MFSNTVYAYNIFEEDSCMTIIHQITVYNLITVYTVHYGPKLVMDPPFIHIFLIGNRIRCIRWRKYVQRRKILPLFKDHKPPYREKEDK